MDVNKRLAKILNNKLQQKANLIESLKKEAEGYNSYDYSDLVKRRPDTMGILALRGDQNAIEELVEALKNDPQYALRLKQDLGLTRFESLKQMPELATCLVEDDAQ